MHFAEGGRNGNGLVNSGRFAPQEGEFTRRIIDFVALGIAIPRKPGLEFALNSEFAQLHASPA